MSDPSAQREANCGSRTTCVLPLVLVTLLSVGCGEDTAPIDASSGVDAAADGDADADTDGDSDTDGDGDSDAGAGIDAGPVPCDEQGATRTVDCGFCGSQDQICAADGLWHDDGECMNPGECRPGAIQQDGCGLCGTRERVCSASCTWNEWSACDEEQDVECDPGVEEVTRDGCEPGDIQERRCSDSCRWEALRECGPDCIGDPQGVGTLAEEVCVPGGAFIMGGADPDYDNDDPEHEVVLYPYFIDRYEASNDRYRECVDDADCTAPDDRRNPWYYDPDDGRKGIVLLTQAQVEDFCAWAGRRLPTEAEWEKAARGPSPDRRIFPWGDDPPACDQANQQGCEHFEDVDAYPAGASQYGVERMLDGADEANADWYGEYYYSESPRVDPRGPANGDVHVGRGIADGLPADMYPPLTQRWDGDGGGVRCARSTEER